MILFVVLFENCLCVFWIIFSVGVVDEMLLLVFVILIVNFFGVVNCVDDVVVVGYGCFDFEIYVCVFF